MNAIDAYADDVVCGRVLAGKYHRLSCARHQRDRAREGSADFPYRLDLERAERFFRFASRLKHYKGEWAGRFMLLEPHQKFRLGSIFGWVHVETGLRRFRTAYNELPRKNGKSIESAIVALYVTFFDGEAGAEGYCLHPKTRVLLADLSWRELETVNVGDEIIGIDEQVEGFKKQRKVRHATVTGKVSTRRPALRITFTDGREIVCSPDHKWLSQSPRSNGRGKWRESRELKPAYKISYLGEPWPAGTSRDAGYLAGLYDGEGYLFHNERGGFRVGFAQNPGVVHDTCRATLERLGFHPAKSGIHDQRRPNGTRQFNITGLYECLRLLGEVKPVRLWAKARLLWEGKKFPSTTATIARVERIGYEDMIDIETSSRTFIAEGLVSHNCVATKRAQAKIVWGDSKQLVQSSGLRSRIAVLVANMHRTDTVSKLEPLGADADSTDGLNPSLIIVDEFHAMKDRGLIDVMETATGARRQPLMLQITTAGDDPVSPCGDQHDYCCKILDEVLVDETFFGFISHADIGDDWLDPRTWRKANPNYAVSVRYDDLQALATKAQHMPAAAAAFRQKRLNEWINTSAPWLSLDGWRRGQTSWTAEDLIGQPCWIGVDLSSKIDLAAVVCVFPPTPTRLHWRLLVYCLTPEDTLLERARRDRAPYPQWVIDGYLLTNPGNRIDQHVLAALVRDLAAKFKVQGIGFDPWNAGTIEQDLAELGLPVVEVPQTLQQMSAPSKDFEADVLDGLVDAGGNPLMAWCISNVVVQRDGKDNIYPVKKKSRGRIDPVVAAIMARKLASATPAPPKTYQLLVLGGPKPAGLSIGATP